MADILGDLHAFVHSHRVFFDKLVELIPPKFYIPNEDAVDTWNFKKSKEARLAAKKATRENLKKAKRNKLDPDKFKSTLQVIQEKAQDAEPLTNVDGAKGHDVPSTKGPANPDRAVTYDDLRERLHKRIELLRSKRHAETAAAATESARNFRNEKKSEAAKRTIAKAASNEQGVTKEWTDPVQSAKRQKISQDVPRNATQKSSVTQPIELEFSRVKMGGDLAVPNRKHRKDTKESLLKKATELHEQMQEQGEEAVKKHAWTTAVSRAAGEKVRDDPALLRNSIRREKQQKGRSAKKWKERKDNERRGATEKQKTRRENIAQRSQTKKDRAIAKRDKKLMRPGFEGRKTGFINS